MKYSEAKKLVGKWHFLELMPHGRITTKEQYEYVKYYAEHASIDDRYIGSFDEVCGKYLCLGSWFGGASFYFHFSDKPEGISEYVIRDELGAVIGYEKYYEDFTYGICGKIEFDD